jgi:chromosome segregation ATPase
MMIEELLERCLSELDASGDERGYARGLVQAVWDAHAAFMAYTSGARELIEQQAARVAELAVTVDSMEDQMQGLESRSAQAQSEAAALRHAAEAQRMRAEAAEADLRNRLRDVADLEARLAAAQHRPG